MKNQPCPPKSRRRTSTAALALRPTGAGCAARPRFTLIELLVVVAIIAILAAMLLPVLSRARDSARVALCLNNQKQVFLANDVYAGDYEEYPTNYAKDMPPSWNWGDECSTRWNGAPPEKTSWAYNTPPFFYPNRLLPFPGWPLWATSAMHRMLADNYIPYVPPPATNLAKGPTFTAVSRCTAGLPTAPDWSWKNRSNGEYNRNGPHSRSNTVLNNAGVSGMYSLGLFQKGETWGPRFNNPGRNGADRRAFLGCPAFTNSPQTLMQEPHGFYAPVNYSLLGLGNSQFDNPNQGSYKTVPLNRNYTFADGHSEHINSPDRYFFEKL